MQKGPAVCPSFLDAAALVDFCAKQKNRIKPKLKIR